MSEYNFGAKAKQMVNKQETTETNAKATKAKPVPAVKSTKTPVKIDKVERTVISLSITVQDKERIRQYASKHGMTAAAVFHQLIETLPVEE